jgi:DNA polymerase-3 subunit beta
MEFTVSRNTLLGELNLVQGVVEKRSTIPILANILLEASGKRLDLVATDLDVSICCGCSAEVQKEGTMTVSARRLFDIVRLLPEESEIHCNLMENDWMRVKSGNSDYKVAGLPKENFPSIPQPGEAEITIPGQLLRAMIQRTMFAITQEESRYSLNGALMVITQQEMKMVATDGHRLALVSKEMVNDAVKSEIKSLVPRKTLVEILRLVGDQELFVEFGRDENHLFFKVGEKRLISRVLAGQFPNYELVIPRDNDKDIITPTRVLSDGIRRASIMSDEKLRAVRLSFEPGVLEITARNSEAGEAKELVNVEFEGQGMEIGFNPQYLIDFLGACGSESVCISVKDGDTQGMLAPAGESDLEYNYVVMPMKF